MSFKNNDRYGLNVFLKINKRKNISKILFYPYIGCGYANKIPTLVSSIFLSLVSFHPLLIVDWSDLLFYFTLPKDIFIPNYNNSNTLIFNRKNVSVIKELKNNKSIIIYSYHSYISSILLFFNLSNFLIKLLHSKMNKYRNLESVIESTYLIPTPIISKYIYYFKRFNKYKCTIATHIRTGFLTDFGEKDIRFFNRKSFELYISIINRSIITNRKCNLFIISDSTKVKNYMMNLFKKNIYNFTIPGKICHARYSMHKKNKINRCVVKLIAENYILSQCSILIGTRKSTYFGLACRRNNAKCISI